MDWLLPVQANILVIIGFKFSKTSVYCAQYALHGSCNDGKLCKQSHDLDIILDEQEKAEKRPEKKIKISNSVHILDTEPPSPPPDVEVGRKTATDLFSQDHSASFDAYMTAFVHCYQTVTKQNTESKNRLYLIGKDIPLIVEKSKYSKCSKHHSDKMAKI